MKGALGRRKWRYLLARFQIYHHFDSMYAVGGSFHIVYYNVNYRLTSASLLYNCLYFAPFPS